MCDDPSSQLLAEQLKHLNTLYKARMDAFVGWAASFCPPNLMESF